MQHGLSPYRPRPGDRASIAAASPGSTGVTGACVKRGVGVGEAALTAGLTTIGIPAEIAAAAAITHRLVTSYLPPVFGFFTSRWLTEHDYL